MVYENWMSAFYDSVQMGIAMNKKIDEVMADIKAEISGESQQRQEAIEAWAQGDESKFNAEFSVGDMEELSLDEIGKMLLAQREGDDE